MYYWWPMIVIYFLLYAVPGKPRDVDIESLNRTCIDASWREPDFDGGIINDYMVITSRMFC